MARKIHREVEVLTEEQESVLRLVADGRTWHDAARETGVPVAEVSQWLDSSALFVAGLNAQRLDQYQATVQRLRLLGGQAVDVLTDLLDSDNETIRLKAATAALKAMADADAPSESMTTVREVNKAWQWRSIGGF